jgi:predicted thioesterase
MDLTELILPGMGGERSFQVEEQYTAAHLGSGSLRVLATPSMILFMERAAHSLLAQRLPEGYSSVGILVDVRHLAPTPLGANVRITCEVLEVDGLRVTFNVQAWDEQEKVGEGRHQRAVINKERFLRRVESKITG